MSEFEGFELDESGGGDSGVAEQASEVTPRRTAPPDSSGAADVAASSQREGAQRLLPRVPAPEAKPDPKRKSFPESRKSAAVVRCPGYAPWGTRCKLCGTVHP